MDGYPPQSQSIGARAVAILVPVSILLCIWTIFRLTFAYGTLHVMNLPSNATLRINGHVTTAAIVKLHPGTYQIGISSPATVPVQSTLHVGLFQTVTYSPTTHLRDPSAIASSVIGAFGSDVPVDIYHQQWLENNTWLMGTLLPGNAVLVLHYDKNQGKWVAAYFTATGYPADATKLPPDVAAALKQMETTYAPG